MSRQVLTYPDMPPVLTQSTADLRYLQKSQADALYQPIGSYASAGHNHDAAYVNVGGDTMTGALTVTDASIQNASIGALTYWGGWKMAMEGANWVWRDDTGEAVMVAWDARNVTFAKDIQTDGSVTAVNYLFSNAGLIRSQSGGAHCDVTNAGLNKPNGNLYLDCPNNNLQINAGGGYVHGNSDATLNIGHPGIRMASAWFGYTVYANIFEGQGLQAGGSAGQNVYLNYHQIVKRGGDHLQIAGTQYFEPEADNFCRIGGPGNRWTVVYAVSGGINTCSRDVKEIIGEVDDAVALSQLMGLPAIYRFYYKHQEPVPDKEGETILVTDRSMEFLGPVAEEMPMDMKVGDEVTVGNVNTEGHLMASLRGAVKEFRARLDALEAARV